MNPQKLWDNFKIAMSEDLVRRMDQINAIKQAYFHINYLLKLEGKSISDFPKMEQITENVEYVANVEDIQENSSSASYDSLNEKQKEIVDTIMHAIEYDRSWSKNHKCFYIDGPGGWGKTYIYSVLYDYRKKSKK